MFFLTNMLLEFTLGAIAGATMVSVLGNDDDFEDIECPAIRYGEADCTKCPYQGRCAY